MTTHSPRPVSTLEVSGSFALGCNYWASHAGIFMWRDWRPDVINSDFETLAANGIELLRVFPLWPDFQPISLLRAQSGLPVEMRFGEAPLPTDPVGRAGVSAEMLERFAVLCKLADQHGLRLIVGLVTGWMSGRLFVPPALEGLNPITDSVSIAWQIKYVRTLVENLRSESCVVAWDLGNECNCMGPSPSREASYLWTASIGNTIRAADSTRPVISGMHGLSAPTGNPSSPWVIDDQAELTDILTTHPYPYFTRHTRNDAVNAFRTTLHATAESRFYADLGGKPCFVEEVGVMGPMIASEEVAAEFARVVLYSLWANDCRAFLWWCNHDQTELVNAPYDWIGVELELGLLRTDHTCKPVLREMGAFHDFLRTLPFDALPPRRPEAVCLLTHGQDNWAAAYGAFVLGKQAKLEMDFRHIDQSIPEAPIYLLPSITGMNCIPRRQWRDLLSRVRDGATMYLSLGDGIVPHFNEVAGVELVTRAEPTGLASVSLSDAEGSVLPLLGADKVDVNAVEAEVLGVRSDNGSPAFWKNHHGKGQIIVFAAPIETALTQLPGTFDAEAPPYWKVYQEIARSQPSLRRLEIESPHLAVTEHTIDLEHSVAVVINHTASAQTTRAVFSEGFAIGRILKGAIEQIGNGNAMLTIAPHDAVVFTLEKTQ